MKTRLIIIGAACLVSLLVVLCVTARLASHDRNLLLVIPGGIGSARINVQDIDDFARDNFPVSYEIQSSERASLAYSSFPVTLIGTSSGYANIFGFFITEGAFFSQNAWSGKLNHAVLNERAAFNIFGSYNITGSTFSIGNDRWIVTGVIDDGYEESSRIYIPSSIRGGDTTALAMRLSSLIDEAYIKNSLKLLGIMEQDFIFINFNLQISRLWERVTVLLLGIAASLLLFTLFPLANIFKKLWKTIKNNLEHLYMAELFQKERRLILKSASLTLILFSFPPVIVFLLVSITSICLYWQDIPFIGNITTAVFTSNVERLYRLELVSRIVFPVSIILMIILLCAAFFSWGAFLKRRRKGPCGIRGRQTAIGKISS